jgi:hypothetical protein
MHSVHMLLVLPYMLKLRKKTAAAVVWGKSWKIKGSADDVEPDTPTPYGQNKWPSQHGTSMEIVKYVTHWINKLRNVWTIVFSLNLKEII